MTIEETIKKKKEVEENIHELIRVFQVETNISVVDIEMETINIATMTNPDAHYVINGIKLKCEL